MTAICPPRCRAQESWSYHRSHSRGCARFSTMRGIRATMRCSKSNCRASAGCLARFCRDGRAHCIRLAKRSPAHASGTMARRWSLRIRASRPTLSTISISTKRWSASQASLRGSVMGKARRNTAILPPASPARLTPTGMKSALFTPIRSRQTVCGKFSPDTTRRFSLPLILSRASASGASSTQ